MSYTPLSGTAQGSGSSEARIAAALERATEEQLRLSKRTPDITTAKEQYAKSTGKRPLPTPGVMSRFDAANVVQGKERFDREVRQPILSALLVLQKRCIVCLLNGRNDWNGHHFDYCLRPEMSFRFDPNFITFKKSFKSMPSGFCYGCFLNTVRYFSPYL